MAERLRQLWGIDVVVGYGAPARPAAGAVAELRADNKHAAVASYLLAPDYFHDQLAKAGADVVRAPLATVGQPPVAVSGPCRPAGALHRAGVIWIGNSFPAPARTNCDSLHE
ncbi:hypothetical protein [Arthrobacter pigmenti]